MYLKRVLDKSDKPVRLGPNDVYVIWWSKTLQNWKALISTNLPDGRYYEVTYDGDREQTFLDVYVKIDNVMIPDEEPGEQVNLQPGRFRISNSQGVQFGNGVSQVNNF
jgi:hypothetical protein